MRAIIRLPLLFSIAASSALLLNAAEEPNDSPRRKPSQEEPRRREPAPQRSPSRDGAGRLTDEQREMVRETMEANRDKLREFEERSRRIHRELEDLATAEKIDEPAIRERASALAEIESNRILLRARAMQKLRASLSAEQFEQIRKVLRQNRREMTGDGREAGPRFQRPAEGRLREGPGLPPPDPSVGEPRGSRPPDGEFLRERTGDRDRNLPPRPRRDSPDREDR